MLGRQLAQSLDAHVGSGVVLVVQAADGSLGNELFTVAGVLQRADETVDSGALMHASDFADLFVSGDRVHEIPLTSHGTMSPDALATLMKAAAPRAEVRTWRQLMPAFSDMLALFDGFTWVFGLIFGLAAGLGVMNTTLMAMGPIRVAGRAPSRFETGYLALLGCLIGLAIGAGAAGAMERHGLDVRAFYPLELTISGLAIDPILHARISVGMLATTSGAVLAAILTLGVIPIRQTTRLRIVFWLR